MLKSLKLRQFFFWCTTLCWLKLIYPWKTSKPGIHEFLWAFESLEDPVKIQVIFQEL